MDVHEEYKRAFRTKSYLEIRSKILDDDNLSLLESSIPPETHKSIANYFEVIHEATAVCESLLANIHRARDYHRPIKNVLAFVQREPESSDWAPDQHRLVYKTLASFASNPNPFSRMGPENFRELHSSHVHLFRDLTSQCKKRKRKELISKCMGLGVARGLGAWASAYFSMKWAGPKCGVVEKLDVAARGMFIMMNDFESLSWVVMRLRDEMEHRKFATEICVRKGRDETLMEVVRDFQMHESRFSEELEELEKEICLCFLDINRSRRLLC